MSKVSEKAPVPPGSKVSIIPKEDTKFNPSTLGTYSLDDSKFLNGTLISREDVAGGYAGIIKYEVKLDGSNEVITFNSSPTTYLFKVNSKPLRGGNKRKSMKLKNTHRKSGHSRKTRKVYKKNSKKRSKNIQ